MSDKNCQLREDEYTMIVDGQDIEGFNSVDPKELGPILEKSSEIRRMLKKATLCNVTMGAGREVQAAFYEWVTSIVELPERPWTFDVHDETQGPDWLVVYASSHFTDMTRVPGGEAVSIGVAMRGREVWLKCHRSHGMISDDETEVLWIAEKALENTVLTPADRGWRKL